MALVTSACQTVTTVTIDGAEDGSGTVNVMVSLDEQATQALGDAAGAVVEDLTAAGWEIAEPSSADGSSSMSGTKGYSNSDELSAVLEEVGGVDGIFSDTFSTVESGFAKTTYAAGTTVTVTGDPAQFSDVALTQLLGGLALGRTPEEAAFEGLNDPGAATLVVEVNLPGLSEPSSETFDLTGGETRSATVAAESTISDSNVWKLLVIGIAGVVAGAVILVWGVRRRRVRA